MVRFRYNYDASSVQDISNKSLGKSKAIINVCAVIILVCGLLMLAMDEVGLGIIFIVLGIGYFVLVPLLGKLVAKNVSKAPMVDPNTVIEYCFKENTYTVDETLENKFTAHRESIYDMFYKVEEKADYFMLWLAPSLAEPLMKNKIVEGTIEELEYYFTINLGNKYIGTRMQLAEEPFKEETHEN